MKHQTVKLHRCGFEEQIIALIEESRHKVVSAVNMAMVYTYFEVGRRIVDEEQNGNDHAGYGDRLIEKLAKTLTAKFGRGYSAQNLRNMRQFYLIYAKSQKCQTLSSKFKFTLSWSHYLLLMRMEPMARQFYEIEACENGWSVRELERQYNASLYERLALSRSKQKVLELSTKGQIVEKPEDALKDPYVLEFTGLPELPSYTESQLEQKLIDHLQDFLLEMGKGFAFVGRQVRITDKEDHYYIDLVFYNRLLRCFVLVDLKRGKLRHQDIGQMQMYVNYYDRKVKLSEENPTIGILLCADKSDFVVKYSLPEENNQIFARQYKTVLPSKTALKRLVQAQIGVCH